MRVLIANRGEIARRIIRSTDAWGVESVAVWADPDEHAGHVAEATHAERIGPAALDDSYLSVDAILAAAARSKATHVHPGYGFLSERTDFAEAVVAAGLVWVGPSPDSVRSMGSKIEARSVAQTAGVPVIPGFDESQDDAALAAAAEEIGFPVLVKASAGGGGKGIRIAWDAEAFPSALAEARAESLRAFGDDAVLVERYITRPRHIEVQIVADRDGTVVDLGTRECSVQRRYQKVLEEAPAPNLPPHTEQAMRSAAVSLAAGIGYDSLGTVEFVVDAATDEFFFLEMNTRIQVEHTVTEVVTGHDLVHLQLAAACGERLDLAPTAFDDAIVASPIKHAFEARINAEDPWNDHLPQTGSGVVSRMPGADHRWDAVADEGWSVEIGTSYDSMIGKLIIGGTDRFDALTQLTTALAEIDIRGLTTNVDLHQWLVRQPDVRAGRVTTRFLDEAILPARSPFSNGTDTRSGVVTPWNERLGWRLTPHRSELAFDSPTRDDRWHSAAREGQADGELHAPFPGLVTGVEVAAGDTVVAGQTLLTIEAMKMLHPILATGDGTVAEVHVELGEQLEGGAVLVTFVEPPNEPPAQDPSSTGDDQ
jgi:acetyl/propionyl-CoA carboxylase alpha subunit